MNLAIFLASRLFNRRLRDTPGAGHRELRSRRRFGPITIRFRPQMSDHARDPQFGQVLSAA
jgi:hypothetical protein